MGAETKIEWTDHTFNPWRGCAHAVAPDGYVHPGCANCYAECQARRFPELLGRWGGCSESGTRVVAPDKLWDQVLTWNKRAERDGVRRHVFCASIADVFEDWRGPLHDAHGEELEDDCGDPPRNFTKLSDIRARLFRLIDRTPNLDWLLLTKRPWNVRAMWPELPGHPNGYRDNVWLGTSVSDQATADRWLPSLVKLRGLAANLFVSAEPLLGPVNLGNWLTGECEGADAACESGNCIHNGKPLIDWVIVGGESGPKSRAMPLKAARSIVKQCRAAGVAVFVKQLGAKFEIANDSGDEWPRGGDELIWRWKDEGDPQFQGDGVEVSIADKADRKAGEPAAWPEDLRVRMFPGRPLQVPA